MIKYAGIIISALLCLTLSSLDIRADGSYRTPVDSDDIENELKAAWEIPKLPENKDLVTDFERVEGQKHNQWENLRKVSLFNTLWGMYTLPGTDYRWAVGDAWYGPDGINTAYGNPILCRSTSASEEWEILQPELASDSMPDANVHLYTVFFIDEFEGWAGGRADGSSRTAVIYFTKDGGTTWTKQYEGTFGIYHGITEIVFVNESSGWAVGAIDQYGNIAILHTGDGGENWEPQVSGINAAVTQVDFIDEQTGFAMANLGYTLGTVNGGEEWTIISQESSFSLGILGMDFANDTLGVAANAGGSLYRTVNGGVNWSMTYSPPHYIMDIELLNDSIGWAAGEYGTVVHTVDGGGSWQLTTSTSGSNNIKACSAVDAQTLWVAGNAGTIAHTDNTGNSWQEIDGDGYISSETFKDLAFVDGSNGWVVGYHGEIVHTDDGGRTWHHQGQNIGAYISSVDFVSLNEGWIAGTEIWHTSNGGDDWELQFEPAMTTLIDICFENNYLGWACGAYGTIYRTTSGGSDWKELESGTAEGLYGIYFANDSLGWCVGWNGTIIATTDSGNSWHSQSSGVSHPIYSVSFADSVNGWAVGFTPAPTAGTVLHTSNGGNVWETQYLASAPLRTVHFIDSLVGCAAGGISGYSFIICTEDGGKNWAVADVPNESVGLLDIGKNLQGIFLVNEDIGYAVGAAGTVLKSLISATCGDANGDGLINILDITFLINYLYKDGPAPEPIEIGDVNSSGDINILDITYLIAYLYKEGPEPDCP